MIVDEQENWNIGGVATENLEDQHYGNAEECIIHAEDDTPRAPMYHSQV